MAAGLTVKLFFDLSSGFWPAARMDEVLRAEISAFLIKLLFWKIDSWSVASVLLDREDG